MWRRSTIATQETLADVGVWEYSLPRSGVLSGVLFHIANTNGGTDNLINPIYKAIRSMQLVDGGRVLLDVSGVEAEMLSLLANKGEARSVISEVAGVVQTMQALLLFGRHLFDNDVGLDLSKLVNPKLRVDVDFGAVRVPGAASHLAGYGKMSAVLFMNDGADIPTPSHFIKSHEIKRWTTAASGDEVTQGPVDGPWMRLIVRAHVAGSLPEAVLTDIKVSFDSGQLVAIDEKMEWGGHSLPLLFGRYPRFEFSLFRTDAETIDLEHGSIKCFTIASDSVLDRPTLTAFEHGNVVTSCVVGTTGVASVADQTLTLGIWPVHPFMSTVYDFVEMGNLDAPSFERADISLTQGVISAAASLVLQQLMENKAA